MYYLFHILKYINDCLTKNSLFLIQTTYNKSVIEYEQDVLLLFFKYSIIWGRILITFI